MSTSNLFGTKQTLVLASLAVMLAMAGPAGAETKEGSGTRGGGEAVEVDGSVYLRDLVDKTVCVWTRASDFVQEDAEFRRILAAIEGANWYLHDRLLEEMDRVSICPSEAELMQIPTDDEDNGAVAIYKVNGLQVGIRIQDRVFLDMRIVNRMNAENRAYLVLHELMHGFLDQDLVLRNAKLRNFVHSANMLVKGRITPSQFGYQLKLNQVQAPEKLDTIVKDREKLKATLGVDPSLETAFNVTRWFVQSDGLKTHWSLDADALPARDFERLKSLYHRFWRTLCDAPFSNRALLKRAADAGIDLSQFNLRIQEGENEVAIAGLVWVVRFGDLELIKSVFAKSQESGRILKAPGQLYSEAIRRGSSYVEALIDLRVPTLEATGMYKYFLPDAVELLTTSGRFDPLSRFMEPPITSDSAWSAVREHLNLESFTRLGREFQKIDRERLGRAASHLVLHGQYDLLERLIEKSGINLAEVRFRHSSSMEPDGAISLSLYSVLTWNSRLLDTLIRSGREHFTSGTSRICLKSSSESGKENRCRDSDGVVETHALGIAVIQGNESIVRRILSGHPDPGKAIMEPIKTRRALDVLTYSIESGNLRMARLLLGAAKTFPKLHSPACAAMRKGDQRLFAEILAVDQEDAYGMYGFYGCKTSEVKDKGGAVTRFYDSPLSWAIRLKNRELVERILSQLRGAQSENRDYKAFRENTLQERSIYLWAEYDSDVTNRSPKRSKGLGALELTERYGTREIVDLIKAHMHWERVQYP